ncbi:MAG: thioredoxin [Oscillospiraceae bacterium]|nr:thioredoxin [Oscillospiraceae bacterium]
MPIIHLTTENFEETVSEGKCLIDFWADWCGPCKMLAPVIEKISEKYEGSVKVCKVNVDEEGELATRFKIMSIPTVMAFSDGKETGKTVGVKPQAELEKLL